MAPEFYSVGIESQALLYKVYHNNNAPFCTYSRRVYKESLFSDLSVDVPQLFEVPLLFIATM